MLDVAARLGVDELLLPTDDVAETPALALDLGTDDVISTVYERGRFEVAGEYRTDDVLFWWSTSYNEAMGCSPQGRGAGWPQPSACYSRPARCRPARYTETEVTR